MTTISWKTATSGDWNTAADWNPATVPNATTADVVLGLAGAYVVTIAAADPSFTVDSVTLTDPTATLSVLGTLVLGGTEKLLAVDAGTLSVGGTVKGGTISLAGGMATLLSGATLDGVTFAGRLAPAAGAIVSINDGLTVLSPGGVPGTIDLLATSSTLSFLDSETVDNVTILMGPTNGYSSFYVNTGTETLTFGQHVQVNQSIGSAQIYAPSAGEAFVNQGTFNLANGYFQFNDIAFTNSGTFALSNGERVQTYGTSFTNSGLITVGAGSTLAVGSNAFNNTGSLTILAGATVTLQGTAYANTGAITVASGGSLLLGGSLTLGQLGSITTGLTGLLDFTGTLDLGGGTLNAAALTTFGDVVISGTVKNGSIQQGSGSFTIANYATLDGITYLGTLVSPSTTYIKDGLTVETAAGGQPGTIALTSNGSQLYAVDSETLNNVSILMGSKSGGYTYLGGSTLTLGTNVVVSNNVGLMYFNPTSLVNNGTILAGGSAFYEYANGFTNNGTITTSGTETVYVSTTNFNNAGHINIGAGTAFNLGNPGTFTNTGTFTVAAGGTLSLSENLTLAQLTALSGNSSGVIQYNGSLDLGGGTLDAAAVAPGGTLEFGGSIKNGTIKQDSATVQFLGGATLDGVTYLGALNIVDQYASVTVKDGLTVETVAGGQPGTINLTGYDSTLAIADSETLDNVNIIFGANGYYSFLTPASGTTLTLGANAVVSTLPSASYGGYINGGTIVNDGTILASSGAQFYEYATSFTNNGTVATSGTDTFNVSSTTFDNAGLIQVGSGTTFRLNNPATFANTGSIAVQAGGTFQLSGTLGLAQLGSITAAAAGAVRDDGTLDLGAGTLSLGGLGGSFIFNTVKNGSIALNGGTLNPAAGGTLDGVTLLGTFIPGASTTFYLMDGLTVETAAGAAGTINLQSNANIYLQDTETLDNVTILESSSNEFYSYVSATGLTFGANAHFNQSAGAFTLYLGYSGDYFDNQGVMSLAGGSFNDSATSFTNDGSIAISNNESLFIGGSNYSFTNNGGLSIAARSTFQSGTGLFTNSGTIAPSDGGIFKIATTTANFTNSGLIALAGGGTLELGANSTLAELGTFTGGGTLLIDSGVTLDLGGGTLDVGTADGVATLLLNGGHITDGTLQYDAGGGTVIPTGSGGTIDPSVTVVGTSNIGPQTTISTADNLAGGTLDIKPGTPNSNVLVTGTLSNGTVQMDGGRLLFSNATLDAITFRGTLDLSGTYESIAVKNGLIVETAAGGSPGVINLTGYQTTLTVQDTETLDNVTISFGNNTGYYSFLDAPSSAVLTLGSGVVINNATGIGYFNGGTLVNNGVINAAGANFYEYATSFSNAGTITTSGTDVFSVSNTSFSNSGRINVGAGTTFNIASAPTFANTGVIAVASGGTFDVGGTLTLAQLGALAANSSGVIDFTGLLDLAGGTLDVAALVGSGTLEITGTVKNGTIKPAAGVTILSSATLDGITYLGTLDLSASGTNIYIKDGLTAETAAGGSPGAINLTGYGNTLQFLDSETIDNVAIAFGNNSTYSYLNIGGNTLTLGAHAVLNAVNNAYFYSGSAVNAGTINATNSQFQESLTNFTNSGVINTVGTTTFNVSSTSFINAGRINVGAGTTFNLGSPGTLSNTGTFAVAAGGTLDLGGTLTLAQLLSFTSASSGLVDFNGLLNLGGGTLDVAAASGGGTLELAGTIANGKFKPGATSALVSGVTLNGVTYLGSLDLSATSTTVYVEGGLTVDTPAGGLPGSINLTGNSATLIFTDSETLDNAVISFGNTIGNSFLYVSGGGVLTLGSHDVVNASGYSYINTGTIVSNAAINAAGTTFQENATSFTNAGTIATSGTESFNVNGATFKNSGLIAIGAGSTVDISGSVSTYSNTGTITIANGGTLQIADSLTLSQLGNVTGATTSVLYDTGTIDLGGGTLDVKPGTLPGNLLVAGVLKNGTVFEDGGTLTFTSGATLDGIKLLGPLSLNGNTVQVKDGLSVKTALGGTPGTIDLSVNGSNLNLLDSETLDNVVLQTSAAGITDYVYFYQGGTQSLTLGSHAQVQQSGGTFQLYAPSAGEALVNLGTMNLSGGNLSDYVASFTNQGSIALGAGETFNVNGAYSFNNKGTIEVLANSGTVGFNIGSGNFVPLTNGNTLATGETLRVDDGSTFDLLIGNTIAVDAANIVLSGPASVLSFYKSASSTYVPLEGSLTTVTAAGTLALLAGRSWTGTSALSDAGVLQLGGGVFTAPSLTVTATGHVTGFGTIADAIANSGSLDALGGLLKLTNSPTGAGLLRVDAASTLELAPASADAVTFNGLGATLQLDTPTGYTGTLTNVAAGNILVLEGQTATTASTTGTTLTVNLSGGGSDTYTLSAALTGIREGVTLDGFGNSDVIFYRYAAANAATPNPVVFGNVHTASTQTQALSITNTAAADGYSEKLDAAFGASTGSISTSGTVNLLAPTATDATDLKVTLITTTDGVKSGSVTLTPQTDGTGVDGQPAINLTPQTVTATGTVYNYATATVLPNPVAFANHHVGDAVTQALTVTNTATADGFSENLDASFASASGAITDAGSVTGIAAGASSTALSVTLNTATAGAITGAATVSLISDGAGIDGLSTTALAAQIVPVGGSVYNYATATVLPNPIAFANHHVGDAVSQALTLSNTAAAGAFSENLDGAFASASGGITDAGSISGVAAGASSTALSVTLNTATAGAISGAATVSLISDGTGVDNLGTTALASQTVSVAGSVYNYATAALTPNPVTFANHHVGDAVSQALTLSNTAAIGAFSEGLDASFASATGGISDAGSVSQLARGFSSTALSVTLNTGTAGAISGSATVSLISDGTGVDTLGTTALASQTVAVAGSVYNYATAAAITPNPIAFANHHVGDAVSQALTLSNTAAAGAFSEKLDGAFAAASGGITDAGSVSGIAAGASSTALSITLNTATAGAISGAATVSLISDGTGVDSLGTTALASQTIAVSGAVYNYATAAIAPNPVTFANHHVGDAVSQALTLSNTAAIGAFSEGLDASFASATGGISDAGSVSQLARGFSSTALSVTLNTGTAGAISGSATVSLISDGTGVDTLGTTALASQTVAVAGSVYNYATAAAITPNPIAFANHHVGDAVSQALTLSNTAAAGAFSENLDGAFAAASGGITDAGSVGIAAGASSTALSVTLNTATAGAISGAATVSLISDGAGVDTLGTTALASQTIAVSGSVYNYATAAISPNPVTFANHHVGDTVAQALTLSNTAAAGAFSEKLDASFASATGGITDAGSVSGVVAGASSSALSVTLNTATAGAISGSATVSLISDGTGVDTLGTTALASQTVAVGGSVYNYATAAAVTPNPIAFANHHVGDVVSQALTLSNTAAAGSFSEKLDGAFAAASGGITDAGSVSGIAAGATSTALSVILNTATAGVISGAATVSLISDGAGVDTLGTTALASQTVAVSGSVYNYATAAAVTPNPITLGRYHVGDVVSQALTIANTATAGAFTEKLDASFAAASGGVTDSGSVTGITPGGSSSALSVVLNTATAGAISGVATVSLLSDGAGIDGLGTTALAVQTVALSGSVYNYATAAFQTNPVAFGNHHVGDTVSQALVLSNTAAIGAFSESLDASFASASGGITDAGSVSILARGASSSALSVSLNTGTAGAISGAATVSLVSDGAGVDALGNTALASQTVTAGGSVYNYATAAIAPGPVSFGIIHVGDTATKTIAVSNLAAAGGFSENLDAAFAAASGAITDSGSVTGITVGSTSSALSVGLNTAAAGVISGAATVSLLSDGSGIDGLGTTAIASQTISVGGTVDNYAALTVNNISASNTVGAGQTINLGTLTAGQSFAGLQLGVQNSAAGPADLLAGSFAITPPSGTSPFTNTGFSSFSSLAAGQSQTGYTVGVSTSNLGMFSESITVNPTGSNASGYSGAIAPETFTVLVDVIACYLKGTRIATPNGDVAIETLNIGDRVLTASGASRPIHWIGRRSYLNRFVAGNRDILPVQIKANALADGVPKRDLFVSPLHAMHLDGLLVPAIELVNDISILQIDDFATIEYFHIELADHDLILAEGAASETYVDDNNRMIFHNASDYAALYPDAEPVPATYCAPRVTDGYALEAIRQALLVQAGSHQEPDEAPLRGCLDHVGAALVYGWAQNPLYPEAPICLDILLDGRLLTQVLSNAYRADLAGSGLGSGNHSFSAALPAALSPEQQARIEVRRSSDGLLLQPPADQAGASTARAA